MMPFGETVTVLRRSLPRDRTGDASADASHEIAGCGIDWNATTSDVDRRDTAVTIIDLYVPATADVVASDQVELPDGSVASVDGRPMWGQRHPMTGWQPGYKLVRLKLVT